MRLQSAGHDWVTFTFRWLSIQLGILCCCYCWIASVVSNSLWPHGLYSPRNSSGQNTGEGSLFLLQGILPTQGSNPGLPHCRQILYRLSLKGNPRILEWVAYPLSSGSSWLRNWTGVSCITGKFFTNWTMREALRGIFKVHFILFIFLVFEIALWYRYYAHLLIQMENLNCGIFLETTKVKFEPKCLIPNLCYYSIHYSGVVVQSLTPVRFLVTPWTVAHQAPLSMGFPRQ